MFLGFNYEYLALLTPQEAVSIALYKGKIENNVTRDAYNYFCKVCLISLFILSLQLTSARLS